MGVGHGKEIRMKFLRKLWILTSYFDSKRNSANEYSS
jgi:hypothetical protein